MQTIDRFVDIAAGEAAKSTYHKRLGAVVLSGGRVISRGHNSVKTHPRVSKYGHYAVHAECDALMRGSGDTLVVVRILKNGMLACSKPCPKCLRFIKDYGIKRVFYIDWDSSIKRLNV